MTHVFRKANNVGTRKCTLFNFNAEEDFFDVERTAC